MDIPGLTPAQKLLADGDRATTAQILTNLLAGIAAADTHITNIEGASTPAQQKAALLFALKGLKQLARLQVHELTAAD